MSSLGPVPITLALPTPTRLPVCVASLVGGSLSPVQATVSIKLLFPSALAQCFLREWGPVCYAQQDPVHFCPHQKADVQQLQSHPLLPRQVAPSAGPSEVLSPTLPMVKCGLGAHVLHMIIRGSGTDSPIDLWGSTLAPLR